MESRKRCAYCGNPMYPVGLSKGQEDRRKCCSVDCRAAWQRAHPKPPRRGIEALSRRERQSFELFLTGMPWKDIAAELGISTKTVCTHRVGLFRKLEVTNPVELVKAGIRHGLATL